MKRITAIAIVVAALVGSSYVGASHAANCVMNLDQKAYIVSSDGNFSPRQFPAGTPASVQKRADYMACDVYTANVATDQIDGKIGEQYFIKEYKREQKVSQHDKDLSQAIAKVMVDDIGRPSLYGSDEEIRMAIAAQAGKAVGAGFKQSVVVAAVKQVKEIYGIK